MFDSPAHTFCGRGRGTVPPMQETAGGAAATRSLPEPQELLVLVTLLLIPIERDLTIWSFPDPAGNYHLRIGMSAFHVPVAALIVLSALRLARSAHVPRSRFAQLAWLGSVWLVVAFAVSPSWRGVDALFHLAAAWAIWDTIRASDRVGMRRLLIGLCLLGASQAALALVQRLTGDGIGVDLLESGATFSTYGDVVVVRGSLIHQYHFVILLLVCSAALFLLYETTQATGRRALLGAAWSFGTVIPLTYSRAAVLAIVPMLAVIALRRRRHLAAPALAWTAGLATGAMLSLDGIIGRTTSSVSGSGGGSFDSSRSKRLAEAWDLTQEHLVTGIGPGNYVFELRAFLGLSDDPTVKVLPSHNFVAHYAAEAGLVGGALAAALLVALGIWTARGGSRRALVVLPMVPFLLLDLFPYTWQLGVVLCGVWLGLAQLAGSDPQPEPTNR